MLQKILIALAIVGMLVFLAFTAYGADYKAGDKIILRVIEWEEKIDADGRVYVDFKQYPIQRTIIKVYDINQYTMVHIRLKKEDIKRNKMIYHSQSLGVQINDKKLLAIAKFRRAENE